MRQNNADWICAVPYGYYMIDSKNMTYEVDEACAEVVRRIFEMYNGGMGYKKIANTLTDEKFQPLEWLKSNASVRWRN